MDGDVTTDFFSEGRNFVILYGHRCFDVKAFKTILKYFPMFKEIKHEHC